MEIDRARPAAKLYPRRTRIAAAREASEGDLGEGAGDAVDGLVVVRAGPVPLLVAVLAPPSALEALCTRTAPQASHTLRPAPLPIAPAPSSAAHSPLKGVLDRAYHLYGSTVHGPLKASALLSHLSFDASSLPSRTSA
jgi:hypothetical protein